MEHEERTNQVVHFPSLKFLKLCSVIEAKKCIFFLADVTINIHKGNDLDSYKLGR